MISMGDLGTSVSINPDCPILFNCPRYFAVSRSVDKIFVSDGDTHTICLTSDGKTVYCSISLTLTVGPCLF